MGRDSESAFWDRQIETLPLELRARLHGHRFQWQVRRCWDGSALYRARFEQAGLSTPTAGGRAEPSSVPLLRLDQLDPSPDPAHSRTPFAVAPPDWWTGVEQEPDRAGRVLTDGDLVHRADRVARAIWAAGARTGDLLRVDASLEDSPTRSAVQDGARRAGLLVVVGDEAGSADAGATTWIVREAPAAGGASSTSPVPADLVMLRVGRATSGGDEAGLSILGIRFVGAALAFECRQRQGLHWADDQVLPEIVDARADRDTPSLAVDGQPGTLVVTDLTREGSPLIRYGTGLRATLERTPCGCGRTSARLVLPGP